MYPMKILFLSAWLPYPPINGAKIRIYNLIRQLARKHEISLLAFVQTIPIEKRPESVFELEKYCRSVKVVPARSFKPNGFSAYMDFFSLIPRSVVQTYSGEMAGLIQEALRREKYDVIVASEVYAPSLISFLTSGIDGVPKILDAIEITLAKDAYEKQPRLSAKIRNGLTWFKLWRFTRDMLRKTNGCTVPSREELKNLRALAPEGYFIEMIPHSLDLDQYDLYQEAAVANSLVFTGSFTYGANLDAVQYFARDIFPLIREQEPAVNLKVIGNLNGAEPAQFPGHEAMTFTGLLQDVRPEVAKSWLSIVPLRLGAGTRLKIVESMALGTPVVSTSKGAEGLEVTHGENILIADTPHDFSRAVLELLHTSALREKLSVGGRALVAEKYSAEVMGNRFNAFLEQIVSTFSTSSI